MRKPLVAGNWKMNGTVPEGIQLASRLREALEPYADAVDLVLLPPSIMLWEIASILRTSRIRIGAQNVAWEDRGAFTGEISPAMLAGWCEYVLIGHSERRHIFGETDEMVNKKVVASLGHHLRVILAVGETLEENEAHRTEEVVSRQLSVGLSGIDPEALNGVSIAYEPVWAIGTGRAATPDYASQIMGLIRGIVATKFSSDQAAALRILYGGSVTAANAASLMQEPEIDGALVGGASLDADQFTAIVRAAAEAVTPARG
ncbi:MAG TPA: triose-phosphate isomerase [Candidatus Limnocylindrales bacterium]|nr:triose-phosphate isomerase [Candidatus Limnocylindrales bacterium]